MKKSRQGSRLGFRQAIWSRAKRVRASASFRIALVIVLSIVPLNVLVIASTSQSVDTLKSLAVSSIGSMGDLSAQQLDTRIYLSNFMLFEMLRGNRDFIALLRQRDPNAYMLSKTGIASTLAEDIAVGLGADGYFIYSGLMEDLTLVYPQSSSSIGASDWNTARLALREWLLSNAPSPKENWRVADLSGERLLICTFRSGQATFGSIISLTSITQGIESQLGFPGCLATVVPLNGDAAGGGAAGEGTALKPAAPDPGALDMPEPIIRGARDGIGNDSGEPDWAGAGAPVISHMSALTTVDMGILTSVPESDVLKTMPAARWVAIIMTFLYLALIPFLLFMLNRVLLKPLGIIRRAILQFNESYPVISGFAGIGANRAGGGAAAAQSTAMPRIKPFKSSEDFRTITKGYNEIVSGVEALLVENYKIELERKDMELRSLQLQIHPHFLLNMLNLVFSLAQVGDNANVQKLTLYLSEYFRYTFRDGKSLEPFRRELALIREYLDINALRYSGGFEAEYEVDDASQDVMVPPLLIHGFVENVVKHALTPGGVIHVRLKASVSDGWALFEVEDDGAGMDETTARAINTDEPLPSGSPVAGGLGRIGVSNARQRMLYHFGPQSRLNVESAPGKGARFTAAFPLPERGPLGGHE